MTMENMLLPTKFAPMSQLGINVVTNWAKANPDLARETSAMLRDNPRTVIDRFFRLTSDQQAGLAAMADADLRTLVTPIAEYWSKGRFPQVEIEFELETDPTATTVRPVSSMLPFNPVDPRFDANGTILQTGAGYTYNQTAPQSPQQGTPTTGRQKCKKVIAKIGEILEILL